MEIVSQSVTFLVLIVYSWEHIIDFEEEKNHILMDQLTNYKAAGGKAPAKTGLLPLWMLVWYNAVKIYGYMLVPG